MGHWAWFTLFGGILVFMAVASSWVKRIPITTSIIYLGLGAVLGSLGTGVLQFELLSHAKLLEVFTEICVSISLFTAGLKLRLPWKKAPWKSVLRLAFISMTLTVGLIALLGVYGLGLPLGAAILLGAILAPTDPVLASDVQVQDIEDADQLRHTLTGEASLNDGTSFPFVMLGLGLLGLHDLGDGGWKWALIDVLWSVVGGLAIGGLLGFAAARGLVHVRSRYKSAVIFEDFLALGLLALAYGVALGCHTYAFLAVFAAAFTLRQTERSFTGEEIPETIKQVAVQDQQSQAASTPEHAPAYAAQSILAFNEQLERLAEVGMVILLGAMLTETHFTFSALWFVPALFLVIRPLSVFLGARSPGLVGWFGIRGVGSLYYLSYALTHGLSTELADSIVPIVLSTIVASIVVHGVSVTPLMKWREMKRMSAGSF